MKTLFAFISMILLLFHSSAQKFNADIIITGAHIIDNKMIIINAGTIAGVLENDNRNDYTAGTFIDAKGKYIIPGLWDMHVHFGGGDTLIEENKNLLPLYIANGVTTVRDAAADLSGMVLQWRSAIAEGRLIGPRIFTSGPKLEGYKSVWIGDLEVGTIEEMKAAIDSLQKMKVDFIKITDNSIRPDIYLAAIHEAKKRGLKISGHVPYALTMKEVTEAGLSSVEHMGYALKAGISNEKELAEKIAAGKLTNKEATPVILETFNADTAMAIYQLMAKNGTAITPTLSISCITAYLDKDDHHNDGYLQYIGKGLRRTYDWRVQRAAQDAKEAIELRHRFFEKSAELLPLLHKAGVIILAGTDAGYLNSFDYPGVGLHNEHAMMVKYGLTPLQALQASVINGPAFFNQLNLYGAIEKGRRADILILNKNPLQNIGVTKEIDAVIANGKLFTRQKLDELLIDIKSKAAAGN
jgi:imidazolonepropionase-like amidohydrolase